MTIKELYEWAVANGVEDLHCIVDHGEGWEEVEPDVYFDEVVL